MADVPDLVIVSNAAFLFEAADSHTDRTASGSNNGHVDHLVISGQPALPPVALRVTSGQMKIHQHLL